MSDYVVEDQKVYIKREVSEQTVDGLIKRAVDRCARIDAEIAKLQAEKAKCMAEQSELSTKKDEAYGVPR